MAALNFPSNPTVGAQYTSDLGTTYIWDGVKWVGHSAGGAVGTNSIANNGHTVQVDAGGNLVLPTFVLPNTVGTTGQVLKWPASGTTLAWSNDNNSGGGTASTGNIRFVTDFIYNGYGITVENASVVPALGATAALTIPANGDTVVPVKLQNNRGNVAIVAGTDIDHLQSWVFGNDGTLTMPLETKLNSGGIGVPNSAEVGTTVAFDGPDIVNSEVFMGSGYGEFRSIYNKTSPLDSGLVYAGVEGFNYANYGDVNFAGMVSQTPNIDSMYALSLNEQGQIVIGFTQDGQTQVSTDWSVLVGTLTTDYTVNGLFANTARTVISSSGTNGIELNTNRGTVLFGNQPEAPLPTDSHHWHIMPADPSATDLFFGNDTNYVKLPRGTGDVVIGAEGPEWKFGSDGILNFPNNNGQIGQLEAPYTGLEFRTGSGADWIGISYGEINDNNTSYFYFDKDGSDYTTANHRAHLQIKNPTHDGHVEWLFDSAGNLKLPRNSTISDQATSVDLTVGRTSDNPLWYNLFGDTGATGNNYANTAINGSVVHDSGGNVYVLGSTIDWNNGIGNNLFLKYSPQGNLLWRRTWTDDTGMNCGSFNASLRYIEANIDLGTQDTIVWAARVPWDRISYIGTMDTEGNLVDQYGDARLPTRLDNFAVTDLVWTGNIDQVGDSTVLGVGQQYLPGPGYHFPAFAGVDLANAAVFSNTTIMPDGTNLNYGDQNSQPNYVNQFKAVTTIPAWNGNPVIGALVGTYYDGDHSHAMVVLSGGGGPPVTYGIGVDNYSEDNITGEDICADANGNVYVIVNNISSNTAVLIKASAVTLDNEFAVWKLRLGPSSADGFYASAVAYDNGYVYVLGQYYDDNTGDRDAMIIKVGIGNGNVVWQRRIGSPGTDGVSFFGGAGWESSSGISVYDNLIAISFATEARTPGINNGPPEFNTVTLQYPTDGSLTGTYGDFVISDFDIGNAVSDYNITTLTTALGGEPVTDGFAALQATTATVGTGWTNTQWDLENNREVFGLQTFKFNTDGTFDTAEIKHQGEVKITANTTAANATAATWTFQNNRGLRFPDGTVQYGAYIETEMALDGGSAVSVYNILPRPPVADGGGSASRFGVNDPVYDGSGGNDYVLDGGGA